jgi:hypothetical protein
MTDLKNQLMRLLADEPDAPDDLERIVGAGRRARRRRQTAVATAGTLGAAGIGAAVAVPLLTTGGGNTDRLDLRQAPSSASSPSPSPTGPCYIAIQQSKADLQREIAKLRAAGKLGAHPTVTRLPNKHGRTGMVEVCAEGVQPVNPAAQQASQEPAGPPYHYTEDPSAISARLGTHLHNRVTDFGLTISYTRPFSQESSNLDKGSPSYYGGNVDIHETDGYGDIGVQVTHKTTELVPFDGDCTTADHCTETKLPDGSILRTDQVDAGRGDTILTAEVHRPDGVIVQAQESDYPFGPDAGSQAHGDQPLSLDQLVSLATDADFTF